MSDAQERIKAARAKFEGAAAAQQAAAAPARKAQTQDASTAQAAVKTVVHAEQEQDITQNRFHQIMNDNAQSNDQKIKSITTYLTADKEDYATARKRFAEFEAYFNYAQGEGQKLDMKGINRLIDELKAELKPAVEQIVKDVSEVQQGVDESKKMLEVLRAARVSGQTIDQVTEALKMNDRLQAQMQALQNSMTQLQEAETSKQEMLNHQLDRKTQSEKGFFNKIARVFGPDKEIAQAIDLAQRQLGQVQSKLTDSKANLDQHAQERNASLETGPLVILRTMDATEKNFTDNIISTAEKSLQLIENAMTSIQRLVKRTAYSEATARDINAAIAEASVRETIMKGAIQQVALATTTQTAAIKTRLDAKDAEIAETEQDSVQHAVLTTERVDIDLRYSASLDYQEVLNRTVTSFETITANGVQAKSRVNTFAQLVQAEKELLQRLSREALPATTQALRMVLETDVAQQTGELAGAVEAVTQKARGTGKDMLKRLEQTQAELHAQRISDMDNAIKALGEAEEAVVGRIEKTFEEGRDVRGRMDGIIKGAAGLREVLQQLEEIRPTVAAEAADAGNGPKRPANDATPPAAEPKVG